MVNTVGLFIFVTLLLPPAHTSNQVFTVTSPSMLSGTSPESLLGFLLLGLTVVLSGCVYLWVLRYICCRSIAVAKDPEKTDYRTCIG